MIRVEESSLEHHPFRILEIHCSDHPDFNKAMRIYKSSFPANERHGPETIKERLDKGNYRFFIGKDDKEVVLMATFWDLKRTSFYLFDYMAVAKKHRRKRFASSFLDNIWDVLGSKKKSLLLEVEDPRCGKNKIERKKRVSFYKRHGAKELKDVRYVLPPLSGPEPTDMILMVLSGAKTLRLNSTIVSILVKKVYLELYGRKDDDPLLKSVFINIPRKIDLSE